MRYRSEIDGLRALAIVPVVLFHAGFSGFSGGFVGVDVFFVIWAIYDHASIVKEHSEGSFSLLRFYERRARRILPALFTPFLRYACPLHGSGWRPPICRISPSVLQAL